MPIYEYECHACGHHLETIQKVSEPALTECPNCHQSTLNKLISAAGFQLKGTGWYATDFRNKDKSSSNKTSESTDSGKGKDDTSSTSNTGNTTL